MIKKKTKEVEDAEDEEILYRLQLREGDRQGLATLVAIFLNPNPMSVDPDPIGLEEQIAPLGINSYLTLNGSNITLNSGNTIRYVRGLDTSFNGNLMFGIEDDAVKIKFQQ